MAPSHARLLTCGLPEPEPWVAIEEDAVLGVVALHPSDLHAVRRVAAAAALGEDAVFGGSCIFDYNKSLARRRSLVFGRDHKLVRLRRVDRNLGVLPFIVGHLDDAFTFARDLTREARTTQLTIDAELERCRRGVYTGAIGYFSDHGRVDFNIAIRTIVIDGAELSYHVGGGIVADSDPLSEYRETLAKGRRIREVLLGEC